MWPEEPLPQASTFLKPQEANGTGREIGLLHIISVLMILLKTEP